MKEFKFDCQFCGQHIQAAEEWGGRQITCPACQKPLVIPAPAKQTAEKPASPSPAATKPEPAKQKPVTKATETPASPKPAEPATGQPETKVDSGESGNNAGSVPTSETDATSAAETPASLRIAALTPTIKLEMVRAVRGRIANESGWIPGKIDGKNAYATKTANGKDITLSPKSPEATRFSLIGAFLREFHLRNVARSASGRTKLLDHEIPDAVREVLLDEMTDEQREQDEDPLEHADFMSISHSQCLSVLDVLERAYSQRMEQVRAERAARKLGTIRLPDLVERLEKKSPITPEDVATALYYEITDIRRRMERLEHQPAKSRKAD